jgi:CRISPR-associated protein Csm1
MEKIKEHIYLTALLHDIDKFYQWTDTSNAATGICLSPHQIVCHHLEKEQLTLSGQIIKEAACLSLGMDEDSMEVFRKIRMTSILESIFLKENELNKKQTWQHLPLKEISLTKEYFPQKQFGQAPDYNQLLEKFKQEFESIQANDYCAFSETLLNLLYKYAACIPANTTHFQDVSLYDHAKTTAALAICLYDYQQSSEKSEEPFLLIGADFNGIQSYLYQIVSKYAGKNLKGRSFFIRILSDAVVRYLLKELNLVQANVLYNSGGGFYLIAPNTSFVQDKLQKTIQIVEKKFFTAFGISLFVAIDSIPLSKDILMHRNNQDLGKVWHDLFEKRDKKKSSKFASLIENQYDSFFSPIHKGGDALRDEITGEEFSEKEKSKNPVLTIKEDTQQQIILGEKLRETEIVIVSECKLTYPDKFFYINPADLGFYYYFLKEEQLTQSIDNSSIIRFNNCNFNQPVKGNNNSCELQFYGGNEFNGATFEEMTQNPNLSRLGILRMDVDNLGSVFQSGILSKRATLSHFTALSRSFDYFFSGYLNTIWRETSPQRSSIIYSGGDDVFIVGSWDIVIILAKKIREDFKAFTCNNPAFSISGGVAIVSPKFPIMKGAEESDAEEKNAKKHVAKTKRKNAISFLDTPLNWDTEFPVVEKLKNKLVEGIEKEVFPKSFLSKIMIHAANSGMEAHKIKHVKIFWILTCDLSRMKERIKDEYARKLINNCITEICGNKSELNGESIDTDYHPLELWAFVARWAELDVRKK